MINNRAAPVLARDTPLETRTLLLDEWDKQLPLVKPQVVKAHALYQKLLERAAQFAKKTALRQ